MKNISEIRELSDPAVHVRRPETIGYHPLPSQRKFHSAMGTSFKGFSGPIGSGKSQSMAYETVACAVLNPGCIGLVGAPTYPMLRDATQRALFDVLENRRKHPSRSQVISGRLEAIKCSAVMQRLWPMYSVCSRASLPTWSSPILHITSLTRATRRTD